MPFQNVSRLLNDPQRRNVILITFLSLLTILFISGMRLFTQKHAKGLRGAARLESIRPIRSIPGGNKQSSPNAYVRLQIQQNKRAAEDAKKTGRSAIATIVDGFDRQETPEDTVNSKQLRQPVLLDEAERAIKDHQVFISQQEKALNKQQLQNAMYQQMNQMFSTWDRSPMQAYEGIDRSYESFIQSDHTLQPSKVTLIKAGDILNARLLTEVNSDEPSPVLAEITTGNFKKARLIGTLSLSGERLLIQFHTLSNTDNPQSLSISALAIDESTAKTSLAAQVDRHVLLRYGSLAAAAFLQGYGVASQSAVNLKTYAKPMASLDPRSHLLSATGSVGAHFGSEVAQHIHRRPTVCVHAGTAIGVLFSSDVVISDSKEPIE